MAINQEQSFSGKRSMHQELNAVVTEFEKNGRIIYPEGKAWCFLHAGYSEAIAVGRSEHPFVLQLHEAITADAETMTRKMALCVSRINEVVPKLPGKHSRQLAALLQFEEDLHIAAAKRYSEV